MSYEEIIRTHPLPAIAIAASDYDRLVYGAELWDRTRNMKFSGPTSSRVWQELQAGLTGGVTGWWRIFGGEIHIFPAQPAGLTLSFEYVSKNWALSSGSVAQEKFLADEDTTVLSEDLITLGIMWRYGATTKGFDYAENMSTYERELEKIAGRDRAMAPIYPRSDGGSPVSPVWSGTIEDS